jgi:hypothetical protein
MGLLYRVGSFRPCLVGTWAISPGLKEAFIMKQHTLKNCIRTLKKLRDAHHSQLDASALVELDTVIADLKMASDYKNSEVELTTLGLRVLQVIGVVISLVTNIKDLMK